MTFVFKESKLEQLSRDYCSPGRHTQRRFPKKLTGYFPDLYQYLNPAVHKNRQGLENIRLNNYGAMSTAFPRKTVRVMAVAGLERQGVTKGSLWQKGNLLFRNRDEGQKVNLHISSWAEAKDTEGRTYLLYEAKNPSYGGLVIQPIDSYYCFEVSPVEESEK